ncbi:MAG: ubiquinol-cytochrome c reductase iron-sulfur subunit [Parahaliea sp.]
MRLAAVGLATTTVSGRALAGIERPESDKEAVSPAVELPPQIGDRLTYTSKRRKGEIIRLEDIPLADKQIMAVPMDKKNGIVRDASKYNWIMLQRFEAGELGGNTQARAPQGIVGYSAICTHMGCIVSSWDRRRQGYMCPCHQTVFDPRHSGDILYGPAPRRLPSIPIHVEDGELVIAGDFDQTPGFGKPEEIKRL